MPFFWEGGVKNKKQSLTTLKITIITIQPSLPSNTEQDPTSRSINLQRLNTLPLDVGIYQHVPCIENGGSQSLYFGIMERNIPWRWHLVHRNIGSARDRQDKEKEKLLLPNNDEKKHKNLQQSGNGRNEGQMLYWAESTSLHCDSTCPCLSILFQHKNTGVRRADIKFGQNAY